MTLSMALVGFMGAGKTRVGMQVAQRLGARFVDTDRVIGEKHGAIPDLFATLGEEGFRRLEREVVLGELRAAAGDLRVVALGGGAVMDDDVREALKRLPHVVWLDAPPRVLFRRARSGRRPLAVDPVAFETLYRHRLRFYEEVATSTVRTRGREKLTDVVDLVLAVVAA